MLNGTPEKDVGAALVELAAELAACPGAGRCHVELEEGVAGHQRHLVQLGHVPGADDDAARVGVGLEGLDHVGDLVDVAAVGRGPAAPLHAVDRARGRRRRAPTRPRWCTPRSCSHLTLLSPRRNHSSSTMMALQKHLLGGDQRKAFVQVEAHLVAEHAARAGAGAVALAHAVREHVAHEVFVLGAHGARGRAVGHGRACGQRCSEAAVQDCARSTSRLGWRADQPPFGGAPHERTGFLHQPAVARAHRALDDGRAGRALHHGVAGLRHHHEGARVPGRQPHGQGACGEARVGDRHRGGGHLRLPGRRLPREAAGAAAGRTRTARRISAGCSSRPVRWSRR